MRAYISRPDRKKNMRRFSVSPMCDTKRRDDNDDRYINEPDPLSVATSDNVSFVR